MGREAVARIVDVGCHGYVDYAAVDPYPEVACRVFYHSEDKRAREIGEQRHLVDAVVLDVVDT